MDTLEAMSLLLETVDAGSFSAAARRRAMSVATLTRKVDKLEKHLKSVLLIRSTRRLTLTDVGERYVAAARIILNKVKEIECDAAGEFVEPIGHLVISAPRMFGRLHILPIIADFIRLHDGISVDLQLNDNNVDLTSGAADLAIRIGVLPDSSLIATHLGFMRSVTVASPELLSRFPMPQHPIDLSRLPLISLDIPLPPSASWPPSSPTFSHQIKLRVSGAEAAVDAAEVGIGAVRLLHYQVADALNAGRLCLLLESYEQEPVPVHLLHASRPQLPQKVRRFLDFASSRMRASLLDNG
ncbi:LysR family transcriptional regulator [Paracoccus liaowanqingii]|uniref:LysR family transcriptional regulator n=1 Tax=Paracoccus liaowanqingii TaxID=2560053 RepID=A0A4Z1CLQ3_9RHOB|nr:LysR family transcriptional regulator [Paracoccus liaowanqingii]TGN61755.1 LysR family transcriptional regulator [Paracoccus liaowanqingii]